MTAIIKASGVSKRYRLGANRAPYGTFREALVGAVRQPFRKLRPNGRGEGPVLDALDDVSFEIQAGEVVGIVGRNGSGKSTLLKVLSRITEPSAGRVELYGRVASLLEVGTGFHPELSGRENIFLNGAILGMTRGEIRRKFDEIVAFSEVEKFLDTPVKHYSSGMYVRLAFAVAAHLEPEILIVDEVLAVGDAAFQKKCLGKMSDVATQGRTVLFVSHNMAAVKSMCTRAILLNQGKLEDDGSPARVVGSYLTSGRVSRAEMIWDDPARAPGSDVFRLMAVRLRNDSGEVISRFEGDETITVEIEYLNRSPGASLGAGALLFNEEGVQIFSSISNREPHWHARPFPGGLFRSTCRIPGRFLPEGTYQVSAVVWSDGYRETHAEHSVVEFEVGDCPDIRGDFMGTWVGVVRPALPWTTMPLGQSDETLRLSENMHP